MNERKHILVTVGFVLSVSLFTSMLSAMLVSYYDSWHQFELLNAVCENVLEQEPKVRETIAAALKEYTGGNNGAKVSGGVLSSLGYRISDFSGSSYLQMVLLGGIGFLAAVVLFSVTFLYRNKKEALRIQVLAEYLEQVNTGKAVILSVCGEDDFSKLEDEIYKTVTFLYQTKDEAVQAKKDFAENLSNIAHQIKTPITAISLAVQMLKRDVCNPQLERVEKQVLRLTHLEEALLILSRMDAGTIQFQKNEIDIYTLLVLAADNLQELFTGFGVSLEIPKLGEMKAIADLDWTMEAVMNLMKNCMEHSRGKRLHCSYAQNPLYTEILIWDEGEGFAKEDLPHLFERFYRGKSAGEGGIGIGLALSKEIIERQNGTIGARNRPNGGALFEIRIYSH
ncbi:MAG: HAMP domain-containing histidine kinase [Dorea sp.]|jgi:signal transduction histidine kinase|nr:HAMP domain-containing histidine kinase [Dorea sp.]